MKSLLRYISKHVPAARFVRHTLHVARARLAQRTLAKRVIDENLVVFQAYNGRYACSPKAIYEEMRRDPRFATFRFVWVVDDKDEYGFLQLSEPRTALVTYRSPEYFATFEQAKYWVVNNLVSTRILKAPQQVMLQCWHGTPLKRLRNDIVATSQGVMNSVTDYRRKNVLDVSRFDHLISPSPDASNAFLTAFELANLGKASVIREIGYPRNDVLATATPTRVQAAREKLGITPERKVLLYTPTWRDDAHNSLTGYVHHNHLDLDLLRKSLGDEYLVLYRAHYMISSAVDFGRHAGFAQDVSGIDDINDLYLASDALITDYSSTMFDYANLQRPIFFFMYDRQSYQQDLRGFYMDLEDLPGTPFTEMEPMQEALKDLSAYYQKHCASFETFARRFTPFDDGHAAHRAIDLLVGARPSTDGPEPTSARMLKGELPQRFGPAQPSNLSIAVRHEFTSTADCVSAVDSKGSAS